MSAPFQSASDEIAALQKRISELQENLTKREGEAAALQYELAAAKQTAEYSDQLRSLIVDSDYWRITRPLRSLSQAFPRAAAPIRAAVKALVRSRRAREASQLERRASTEHQVPTSQFDSKLKSLLNTCPAVHGDVTFGIGTDTLRFLDKHVTSESRTLETGAGLSTLVFAYKGAAHTCVTPWDLEVLRIKQHCMKCDIPAEKLTFVVGSSGEVLPRLFDSGPLDLVLIDGGHGFPMPFVDWLYCAPRLNVGGILIVDDTHLWTGAVLRDFLTEDSDWRLEAYFAYGVAFKKIKLFRNKEWTEQSFVLKRSSGATARYFASST